MTHHAVLLKIFYLVCHFPPFLSCKSSKLEPASSLFLQCPAFTLLTTSRCQRQMHKHCQQKSWVHSSRGKRLAQQELVILLSMCCVWHFWDSPASNPWWRNNIKLFFRKDKTSSKVYLSAGGTYLSSKRSREYFVRCYTDTFPYITCEWRSPGLKKQEQLFSWTLGALKVMWHL